MSINIFYHLTEHVLEKLNYISNFRTFVLKLVILHLTYHTLKCI